MAYSSQKQEYLEKTGKENVTFNYLNKNREHVGTILNFILRTITIAFDQNLAESTV